MLPPTYKVRDIDSIPAAHRKAFLPSKDVDVAALRQPVEEAPRPRAAGSLTIPAWTFDRGNVEIYANPDKYAGAGPVVGGGPQTPEEGMIEYDIDFPVTGEYTLTIRYASAEARPVDIFLDGKNLGKTCAAITFGSAPYEKPVRFSGDSWSALKNRELFSKGGEPVKLSVTQGKHTLKFARRGPLPNLMDLQLDSLTPFPKNWKRQERKMRHMERVPAVYRTAFLPPDAVNTEALRLAIRDTMTNFGPKFPRTRPNGMNALAGWAIRASSGKTTSTTSTWPPLPANGLWISATPSSKPVNCPLPRRDGGGPVAKVRAMHRIPAGTAPIRC